MRFLFVEDAVREFVLWESCKRTQNCGHFDWFSFKTEDLSVHSVKLHVLHIGRP